MTTEKFMNSFFTISEKHIHRYGYNSTIINIQCNPDSLIGDDVLINVVTMDLTGLIEQSIDQIEKYCKWSIEREYIEADVMYAIEEYISLKIASVTYPDEYYDCEAILKDNLSRRYTFTLIPTEVFIDIIFSLNISVIENTVNLITYI